MGEFDLIARFFAAPANAMMAQLPLAARAPLGIGDDCALLPALEVGEQMAVSTDTLVEGVHFFSDVSARALGHKCLAVNLSDLAAMGARPLAFTLALTLPSVSEPWLLEFTRGLFALANKYQCPLVGGDTTRGPLSINITVFGAVAPSACLRRDQARVGDDLWVTGELGGAAFAVQAIKRGQAMAEDHPARRALEWPEPRISFARALVLGGLSQAGLDLSDGLLGDLNHMMKSSALPGVILELCKLPLSPSIAAQAVEQTLDLALRGGDDYELLFAADPTNANRVLALAAQHQTRVTRIGRCVLEHGLLLQRLDGSVVAAQDRQLTSYQHFESQ